MGAKRQRVNPFGRLADGLRQAGDWYVSGPYVGIGLAVRSVGDVIASNTSEAQQ